MMMDIFLYIFMMIPLVFFSCVILIQYSFMLVLLLMFLKNFDFFFCNLSYFFGLDYFSYWLIVLTFYVTCLMYLCCMSFSLDLSFSYLMFMSYCLCFFLYCVFSFLNYLLMYIFFEFSLVPLFIIILGWGYQPDRLISGLYLFFYTLFASLPLFLFLMYIYYVYGSMFFDYYYGTSFSFLIHLFTVLAFMVKLPLFMFHFWLPKAHVYSPIFGSMVLAGVLLKIGGYGIIRFMFMYEYIFNIYSYMWYSLSLFGSLLVSLICLIQGDIKCLIAYSSVAHMGLSLMGLLTMTKTGISGSYMMMIGHGLCSSALFCLSNISYERFLSRSFYLNKGLISFMPSVSFFWFIFCCFNMSCPPSLNFISEIYIIMSMMMYWIGSGFYFFFISFLSAFFSFYMFSYSNHGIFHNSYCFSYVTFREYFLCFLHLVPIVYVMLIVDLFF
uniref:NADH-ubiquinone oxidoreductase chain 4 n=1 Tax=Durgades nigropicta TaxID=1792630 RepID=A0A343DQW6_9HEMI|nr:NADH dehydrogenase subunit 4 [Durgades nigropicta]ARX63974.1 NADH dehydrogenase subunit 4 [Durgades nigropicta]